MRILAVFALLALSGTQSVPSDANTSSLLREIQTLTAGQAAMQRDLQTIKSLLDVLTHPTQPDPLVNKIVQLTDEPARGIAEAKVTVVEVSDYHCPFCRRYATEILPKIVTEYIDTGRVRYVFMDFPIITLHPDSVKSHQAAACAGRQGHYWQMHDLLFMSAPLRDVAHLISASATVEMDIQKFTACLNENDEGAGTSAIRERIAQMRQIGITGTPVLLIGQTQADGSSIRILASVIGAQPYAVFKTAIDAVLNTK
jgi:protein-disulfide isomerase